MDFQHKTWPKFKWQALLGIGLDASNWAILVSVQLYLEDGAIILDIFPFFKHTDFSDLLTEHISAVVNRFWFYPLSLILTAFPWFLILLQKSGIEVAKNKGNSTRSILECGLMSSCSFLLNEVGPN